jgi:hypothetical protein
VGDRVGAGRWRWRLAGARASNPGWVAVPAGPGCARPLKQARDERVRGEVAGDGNAQAVVSRADPLVDMRPVSIGTAISPLYRACARAHSSTPSTSLPAADVMNRWSTSAELSTSPPSWILASTLG